MSTGKSPQDIGNPESKAGPKGVSPASGPAPGAFVADFSSGGNNRRLKWLAIGAGIAILLLAGGTWAYRVLNPPLSAAEKQAVEASREEADGFDGQSKEYSYTQLNLAVRHAYAGKCDQAKAVAADVRDHPNGIEDEYLGRINKRIDDICSGKIKPTSDTDAR